MSNKGKKIYLTIIWIVTIIVVIFGTYRFIGKGLSSFFNIFEKENAVAKTADFNLDVTNINVDVDSANVIIEEGDAPSISYTFPESNEIILTQDNGILNFKDNGNKEKSGISFGRFNKEVRITVPRDREFASVNVKTDSGNINIGNIKCSDIKTNLDSGNLILSGTARSLKAEADSGNIDVKGNFENIDAEADSGNITLSGDLHNVKAKADSGNITVNSNRPETEMVLNLDVDSGDITLNGKKIKS